MQEYQIGYRQFAHDFGETENIARRLINTVFPNDHDFQSLGKREPFLWIRGGILHSAEGKTPFGPATYLYSDREEFFLKLCKKIKLPSATGRLLASANNLWLAPPLNHGALQKLADQHFQALKLPSVDILIPRHQTRDVNEEVVSIQRKRHENALFEAYEDSYDAALKLDILEQWSLAQIIAMQSINAQSRYISHPSDIGMAAAWTIAEEALLHKYSRGNPFEPLAKMQQGEMFPQGINLVTPRIVRLVRGLLANNDFVLSEKIKFVVVPSIPALPTSLDEIDEMLKRQKRPAILEKHTHSSKPNRMFLKGWDKPNFDITPDIQDLLSKMADDMKTTIGYENFDTSIDINGSKVKIVPNTQVIAQSVLQMAYMEGGMDELERVMQFYSAHGIRLILGKTRYAARALYLCSIGKGPMEIDLSPQIFRPSKKESSSSYHETILHELEHSVQQARNPKFYDLHFLPRALTALPFIALNNLMGDRMGQQLAEFLSSPIYPKELTSMIGYSTAYLSAYYLSFQSWRILHSRLDPIEIEAYIKTKGINGGSFTKHPAFDSLRNNLFDFKNTES